MELTLLMEMNNIFQFPVKTFDVFVFFELPCNFTNLHYKLYNVMLCPRKDKSKEKCFKYIKECYLQFFNSIID